MPETIEISPNPGPQSQFLATCADIAIYGGSAGSGKSFALLLDPIQHIENGGFGAVIFRNTYKQIKNEGGLWDESCKLYSQLGATSADVEWKFPSGAGISFSYLEHPKDQYGYQGSQIAMMGFDELTHFTSEQFFYMLSRNRSTCGVKPYIRATTNPDADSWVRQFIAWWIDEKTGYAIEDRSGILRYMVKEDKDIHWFNDRAGAVRKATELGHTEPELSVKSVTFIHAKLKDNPKGDPSYESNLRALNVVDRERLLYGNWNIRPAAGLYMKRQWVPIVNALPVLKKRVRYWDRAATSYTGSNDPDYTVGVEMGIDAQNILYVCGMVRLRESPHKRDEAIRATASQDGPSVEIGLGQDPGQAGKTEAQYLAGTLQGYTVRLLTEQGDKLTRFSPFSAQAEAGNVRLLRGGWNDAWFSELEAFDNSGKGHDDIVDATSGAHRMLTAMKPSVFGNA